MNKDTDHVQQGIDHVRNICAGFPHDVTTPTAAAVLTGALFAVIDSLALLLGDQVIAKMLYQQADKLAAFRQREAR